jgi:hypothetical protein
VVFGLILFLAAFPVLVFNEGSSIKRAKTLTAGSKEVVSVAASPIDAANEGKLVHITGDATTTETISDPAFGVSAQAIKLRRNVEMYQWTQDKKSETRTKLGGGEETVTTYTYKKEWSSEMADSSEFQEPQGHVNPEPAVAADDFTADSVTLGAFTLPESLVSKIEDFTPLPVKGDSALEEMSSDLKETTKVSGQGFYVGADPKQPAVGDLKVAFEVVKPGPVSVIARQIQNTFEPYTVSGLGSIEMLQTGTVSAANMFESEQQGNVIFTWILRLVGFGMMFLGIVLIFNPLKVFADVIPFLGSMLGAGLGLLALVIAAPLSIATIALAWLAYRPLLGIPLLIVAIVGLYFGWSALRKKKATPAAA